MMKKASDYASVSGPSFAVVNNSEVRVYSDAKWFLTRQEQVICAREAGSSKLHVYAGG